MLKIALALSFSLLAITPAEAGIVKSIKDKLNNSGVTFRGTYAPPKSPVSVSCDLNGNAYASVSPSVNTLVGKIGISGTRKIKSFNCRGRSN